MPTTPTPDAMAPAPATARDLMHLPLELHLAVHALLPLPALLAARAVCTTWHTLISPAASNLPPARRALLALYLRAARSPAFLATRTAVCAAVQPFDRPKLLSALTKATAGRPLPDDFHAWLQEWPANAVFGGIWPGLRHCPEHEGLTKPHGTSLLAAHRPLIFSQLELVPACLPAPTEHEHLDIHVTPPWTPLPPASRALALLLDDACVNGWQRSKMIVLAAPANDDHRMQIQGRVYDVDGTKGRADRPLAVGWVQYLERELDREDAWFAKEGGEGGVA